MFRRMLDFLAGGAAGAVVAVAGLLLFHLVAPDGGGDGPPTVLDGAIASAKAADRKGEGEVRIAQSGHKRLLQFCRGTCDEIHL